MKLADEDEKLITSAELAARFQVSTETVHRMCRTNKWPHVKVGRLYRFTQEQYETIVTPPAPKQQPRTQRQRITQLLSSV
ncbi:helix-turn-helix domain-containing protein [Arthrobacter jiangjiafuii]|uniref:Helix-turn-helix domain-containing protein n=1 Tax=Arthrobacter jiangjiafuii TaxID=2817475 RepID=A0A975M5K1_9MICC|nr:helix-turn-helix domain-containing protein [Arthrobacter jiangjiafuii]MBP3044849.1 helix-turn-helix domain-containing protein [Arthrobacter jiangjiafuii]QWC10327.1 helix-turn-helix domain-containing protein [Arthrobacter jiangjiafuii]